MFINMVGKKRKGVVTFLSATLASILIGIIAYSAAIVSNSQLRGNETASIALQTRVLTESKYEQIKNQGYSNLAPEERAAITGSSYEREVLVGSEYENDDGYKEREVTINVYKPGESAPRFSLPLTLSTQGNGSVPPGTILPWWGDLSAIPAGFSYCDGTDGTPDLRGRTVIGSGLWSDVWETVNYNLGDTGGERKHKLTVAEMPSHNHGLLGDNAYDNAANDGILRSLSVVGKRDHAPTGNNTKLLSNTGNNQPHNTMMPYRVVHWIMKL